VRLAIALTFTIVSLGFCPMSGRAATTPIALPDCLGRPVVKPMSVTLTCADGGFTVENLKWTGWGESFAAATGTGRINDCEPDCADGHFNNYPMLLAVAGRQTCPNGEPAYERVVYAFVGPSPFTRDAPGTQNPSQRFLCKSMP
jgi:hypothetical protein